MSRNLEKAVRLSVDAVAKSREEVSFRYSARNDSGVDVYLFNRLFKVDKIGNHTIDPSKFYCEVRGSVLHVSKRLVELPDEIDAEYPEVPYLTALPSQERFEERVALRLPVQEYAPYARTRQRDRPESPRLCDSIVFTLGYFVAREPDWVEKVVLNGDTELVTEYGFAIQTNRTVSSKSIDVRCECVAGV